MEEEKKIEITKAKKETGRFSCAKKKVITKMRKNEGGK